MVSLLGPLIPTPHRPLLARYVGDEGGDGPTYADPVETAARVEQTSKQQQLADGRVVTMRARIYWPADVDPAPGDRVEWQGERYRVEQVDIPVWFDGTPMHYETWVS